MSIDTNPAVSMLRAPFPYFGGKSTVAPEVWQRFGDTPNYIEPFFGSGAILLARPAAHLHHTRIETVNDKDALLANFWRAVQHAPDEVAYHADWPVNEVDLHARHAWLHRQRADVERLIVDPDWYDAKIAGWWVWGISQWIGHGWCDKKALRGNGTTTRKRPHLTDKGRGVHKASLAGGGIMERMDALATRLRQVRVCCGDWSRICGPSVCEENGLTAVVLDPPYMHAERDPRLYAEDHDIAAEVRAWALERGNNPLYRIALCGLTREHEAHMPTSWTRYYWRTPGGYSGQGKQDMRTQGENRDECIWFSPHCLNVNRQLSLFDLEASDEY